MIVPSVMPANTVAEPRIMRFRTAAAADGTPGMAPSSHTVISAGAALPTVGGPTSLRGYTRSPQQSPLAGSHPLHPSYNPLYARIVHPPPDGRLQLGRPFDPAAREPRRRLPARPRDRAADADDRLG